MNAYENVSDGAFWVITDKQFDSDVHVGVSILGTATAGSDYITISTPQLFPAYTDTLTVPVLQLDDSESELNEYVIMNLITTDNPRVGISPAPDSTATVTVFDDDMPLVTLSQSATTIAEASGQDIITATLNKVYFTDVVVTLGTGGTATPATDYTLATTITIAAGNLSGTAILTAVQDNVVESDETVVIDILSVSNGVENGTQQVTSMILDDDTGVISVAATAQASEDFTNGLFTISTDKQFDVPVTITFAVSGTATAGTDYAAIAGTTVVLPALTGSVAIPVNVMADDLVEPDETVILTLTGDNHAKASEAPAPGNTATVTIANDDTAHLSVVTAKGAAEGLYDGYFTVSTDKQFSFPVTVDILVGGSATNGVDYAPIGTMVVFPAYTTSITIPVAVTDDLLVEGTEDVSVLLTGTTSGTVLVDGGHPRAVMAILDNDYARLSIAKLNDATESGVTGMFILFSDKEIERDVPVGLVLGGTATGGVDYRPVVLPEVFPAHQRQLDIRVVPVQDELVEGDETVDLSLEYALNENVVFTGAPTGTAEMKIADDDTSRFSIAVLNNTGEGLADGSFVISSTKLFTEPVTLHLGITGSATNGTDYGTIGPDFIFPAYSASAVLPVSVIDDDLVEGSESVTVRIASVGHSGATAEAPSHGGEATVVISDNDYAVLSVEAVSDATEDGTPGLFVIRTDRPVETGVTITHVQSGSATEGVDYTPLGGSVFLPARSLTADIPVIALPDELDEFIENVLLQLTGSSNENVLISPPPDNWASVRINDSAPEPGLSVLPVSGDEGSGVFRFSVTLSPASGKPVSVRYEATGIGDAVPGADFAALSGVLEFAPGETLKSVDIPVYDDLIDEYDESFQLLLVRPENAVIIDNNGVGTIVDNDPEPQVSLSFSRAQVAENGGRAYLGATLDRPSGKRVSVVPALSGDAVLGTDYTVGNDTITINPGHIADSILVTALSDNLYGGDEQVKAAIGSAVNARYEESPAVTLVITDQDQRITFGALPAKRYGDADFLLEGSSTSGLDVLYASNNPAVAVITGKTVTITGAGTATITAGQPGSGLFDPAPEVSQPLAVVKAQLGATAENKEKVYGDSNPALTISYTGFVNGEGETVLDIKPSVATTATTLSNAGSYPVTVSGGSDGNYGFAYTNGALTIDKAPQTITFGELPVVKKGDSPLALTATASSGLAVTYTSSDPAKVTITGSSVKIIGSGTVEITARQGGDLNYLPALDVVQILVIKNPDMAGQLKYAGPLYYPNPFEVVINLNEVCKKALSVRMYDLDGKLVLTKHNKTNQLDCSTLRKGVYLLEIDFGKGVSVKQQVIKE